MDKTFMVTGDMPNGNKIIIEETHPTDDKGLLNPIVGTIKIVTEDGVMTIVNEEQYEMLTNLWAHLSGEKLRYTVAQYRKQKETGEQK
jgi:hypothetical protein